MGRFVKGEVVVLPFPFSDLSRNKRRPALVIANLTGEDMILCMITRSTRDADSITLSATDFSSGGNLKVTSNIRPNRLFTAENSIIEKSKGQVSPSKVSEVTRKLIEIVSR